MKRIIIALVCVAGALAAKFLPRANFEISRRIDEHTHRGTSINNIIFWMLVIVAVTLLLTQVVCSRTGSANVK